MRLKSITIMLSWPGTNYITLQGPNNEECKWDITTSEIEMLLPYLQNMLKDKKNIRKV